MEQAIGMSALKVGVDVPWVTSWSGEAILGVQPCASVSGRAALVQASSPGLGKPQYSKNHLVRQRRTVGEMLCPMCGERTPPEDRWTQVARRVPAGVLKRCGKAPGLPTSVADSQLLIDAGAIAPLHNNCSDRSLRHCPHLKADPNVEVMRFPDRWIILPLMIEATPPQEAPHALVRSHRPPASVAVVTFLQLCGVTGDTDPGWKRHAARYRRAPMPA